MKTRSTEHESLPLSLREILASKGIESSYDRDCRKAQERLERMFAAQPESEVVIPGIEVAYLELDPRLWDQMAFAA
jgi:hypothetical protein